MIWKGTYLKVFNSIDEFTPPEKGIALMIGKADALHLGHIALINEMIHVADAIGCPTSILSLVPDPFNPIFRGSMPGFVLTVKERTEMLKNWPIDYLIYQKMTHEFTSKSPYDFVRKTLVEKMNTRAVIVGWDFLFGNDRSGNIDLLSGLATEMSFQLKVVDRVEVEHAPVKTSYIRELLAEGNYSKAQNLLGYPFFVIGTVQKGHGLGRKIGFPTANLNVPREKLLPRRGVSIVRVLFDDKVIWGLSNIGTRPTINYEEHATTEVWLRNFKGDLVGKELKVEFVKYLREEIKFPSLEELTAKISQDTVELESYLEEIGRA
jgi:riboflavin kinase/FMN adenylyltransferase